MFEIHVGDCLETLRKMPDCSVDSIVTDPPYGLSFMGKRWDYDVPSVEIWAECLRVLKPGGHLLAFARMDGAPIMSATLSQDKAYTVAAFAGLPTHQWYDLIKDDPPVLAGIVKTNRLVVFGGGVPVHAGGALAGSVGVSGGSAEQDRAIAEAGARSI